MKRMILTAALLLPLLAAPAGAAVAPGVRMLVSAITPAAGSAAMQVELTFLNGGKGAFTPPARIAATLETSGRTLPVDLIRAGDGGAARAVAGGFVQARYTLALPAEAAPGVAATLTLGEEDAPAYAFHLPADTRMAVAEAPEAGSTAVAPPRMSTAPALVAAKPDEGNAFLGNLSSYAPIYAVYGPGTDTDARLQISFKYQLFGSPGAVGLDQPWANGIHFAFTQRMFWNLGRKSSPFRSVDFMPEVFYLLPATRIGDDLAIGAQAGFRHESNGREGLASRSLNTIYIQPVATTTIGGLTASAGPRLWLYAGSLEDNPDIRRYRGNTGLFAEIGRPDGWRLTTNSRLNPGSGKGAVDAELSYPLDRIVDTNLNFYVFGQAFTGYGENLLDYDRSLTRVRIGIGIVR
jgi:outer membrane phospholipase A